MTDTKVFSYSVFDRGYEYINKKSGESRVTMQTKPMATWDLLSAYHYIISNDAREATQKLREMRKTANKKDVQQFKMKHFKVATFSGIFSYRKADNLLTYSRAMCLDIDGIEDTEQLARLKTSLMVDHHVRPLLMFVSPSGNGLKVIVETSTNHPMLHKEEFERLYLLMRFRYDVAIDVACKDVGRACYLCYDPECYINPNLTNQ